jgi:hypothetical protein
VFGADARRLLRRVLAAGVRAGASELASSRTPAGRGKNR